MGSQLSHENSVAIRDTSRKVGSLETLVGDMATATTAGLQKLGGRVDRTEEFTSILHTATTDGFQFLNHRAAQLEGEHLRIDTEVGAIATATEELSGRLAALEHGSKAMMAAMGVGDTVLVLLAVALVLLAHRQLPDVINVIVTRQLLSQSKKNVFIAAVTVVSGYMLSIYPGVPSLVVFSSALLYAAFTLGQYQKKCQG